MNDNAIIDLYWQRAEQAIQETDNKYGYYCYQIAYNILTNREDSNECVSDAYMVAWKAMPPHRPLLLATFLGKITRQLSIDYWRHRNAHKRCGGQIPLALDELAECVAAPETVESILRKKELQKALNRFLEALPEMEQIIFLRRYWYFNSAKEIAEHYGFTESKVNSMLHRTRAKLRKAFEKEGLL